MGDAEDLNKPKEVKLYFTPAELEQIDQFRSEWTNLKSRNQLFHVAITYYMDMVRKSGGVMTSKNSFPVSAAAEAPVEYRTRGRPEQKKTGST